jgi:hypothetical protein
VGKGFKGLQSKLLKFAKFVLMLWVERKNLIEQKLVKQGWHRTEIRRWYPSVQVRAGLYRIMSRYSKLPRGNSGCKGKSTEDCSLGTTGVSSGSSILQTWQKRTVDCTMLCTEMTGKLSVVWTDNLPRLAFVMEDVKSTSIRFFSYEVNIAAVAAPPALKLLSEKFPGYGSWLLLLNNIQHVSF